MVRQRKFIMPENGVILTPEAFTQLMAIAIESRRDPQELCSIAIRVFATAIRHAKIMHPPQILDKPHGKPQPKHTAQIGSTVRKILKQTKGNTAI